MSLASSIMSKSTLLLRSPNSSPVAASTGAPETATVSIPALSRTELPADKISDAVSSISMSLPFDM